MTNQKEPVKIILAVLRKQVENGMKRKELSEYYGISEAQMAKALKSACLKIRKFHEPAFQIVDEEPVTDLVEQIQPTAEESTVSMEETIIYDIFNQAEITEEAQEEIDSEQDVKDTTWNPIKY